MLSYYKLHKFCSIRNCLLKCKWWSIQSTGCFEETIVMTCKYKRDVITLTDKTVLELYHYTFKNMRKNYFYIICVVFLLFHI